MTAYATLASLHLYGVPRGLLVAEAREATAVAATDRIALGDHGLDDDDTVLVVAGPGGVVPGGLAEGTVYYARVVTDSVIELAASAGGAAINLTSAGTAPWGVQVSLEPAVEAIAESYSRAADRQCLAHAVPFAAPYPVEVVDYVATQTALRTLLMLGKSSLQMSELADRVARDFKAWAQAGATSRDPAAVGDADLAVSWTSATLDTERDYGETLP